MYRRSERKNPPCMGRREEEAEEEDAIVVGGGEKLLCENERTLCEKGYPSASEGTGEGAKGEDEMRCKVGVLVVGREKEGREGRELHCSRNRKEAGPCFPPTRRSLFLSRVPLTKKKSTDCSRTEEDGCEKGEEDASSRRRKGRRTATREEEIESEEEKSDASKVE